MQSNAPRWVLSVGLACAVLVAPYFLYPRLLARGAGPDAPAALPAAQPGPTGSHSIAVGLARPSVLCSVWKSTMAPPNLPGWCWHAEGSYTALDLNDGPGEASADIDVFHQEYGLAGTIQGQVVQVSGTNCTGVWVKMYSADTGVYVGEEHYLHIDVRAGAIGTSFIAGLGWYFVWLGDTARTQPGCPFDAPHLHQSGNENSSVVSMFTNWCITVPPDTGGGIQCPNSDATNYANLCISPTSDIQRKWVHAVLWTVGGG